MSVWPSRLFDHLVDLAETLRLRAKLESVLEQALDNLAALEALLETGQQVLLRVG